MNKTYERNCPKCNKIITYNYKSNYTYGVNNNSQCKKCSNEKNLIIANKIKDKCKIQSIKDEIYERNCPKCNIIIEHINKKSFLRGLKNDAKCKKCFKPKKTKICIECNSVVKSGTKCRKCADRDLRKHKGEDVWETKEKAVEYLKEIQVNGYIPGYTQLDKQFRKLFSKRMKEYGGYKQLTKEAGLKARNFYKTSDGHMVRSYYEYLFDEFLYLNNIPHEVDGLICNTSKYRYDFKVGEIYIEIWGMTNSKLFSDRYNKRRKIKEKLYKDNNLELLSIERKEFKSSSDELQLLFKNKLKEFNILSNSNLDKFPIFNNSKLDYWCDKTIIQELKELIQSFGDMPTNGQLNKIKRSDLGDAIVKNGGFRKFAKLLGYEPKTKEYSQEYVIDELNKIKDQIGYFPCDRELQEMKRSDLAGMIKTHGGYGFFKKLILGKRDKRPFGYWSNEENIINELKIIISKLGRFPKYSELGQIAKGIDKSKKGMDYFFDIIKKGNYEE